jgi:hypothetical protein
MTLNVKNVKGYDRMPYCNVYVYRRLSRAREHRLSFRHYPQPKPTVIADNPEMQRIRLLTDIQSNVGDRCCSSARIFSRSRLGEIP